MSSINMNMKNSMDMTTFAVIDIASLVLSIIIMMMATVISNYHHRRHHLGSPVSPEL